MSRSDYRRLSGLEISVLALLAALSLAPFACWSRSADAEKSVLRMWITGDPNTCRLLRRAAARFGELHPDVNVKVEIQSGQWVDKYMAAMQANSCADVVYMHWRRIVEFAAKNTLVPLDDLISRDGYDMSAFFDAAVSAYQFQGRQYAVPVLGSTQVLFYNKDLFDAAGMAYPTDDWTWDDFLAAAQKLTVVDAEGRVQQIGCAPYDPAAWIWSGGGDFTSDDCKSLYLTDPKTLAALQFYVDLRNKYKVTSRAMGAFGEDPAAVNVFERGRVAMDISGPWMLTTYAYIKNFRWDVALFPKGPAGRQTRYAGMGFGIWSGSPKQQMAWELVKFMCGPEASEILADNLADVPARREAANSPSFLKPSYAWNMRTFVRALENNVATVHVFPRSIYWPEVQRNFEYQLGYAMLQQKTMAQAMADAESNIRRFISESEQKAASLGGQTTAATATAPAAEESSIRPAGLGDYVGMVALFGGLVAVIVYTHIRGRREAERKRQRPV